MRKFTFSMITMLAFVLATFSVQAQNREVVYEDDFESYNVGDYLAETIPTWWTTWSNTPGTAEDAVISDEEAESGLNAVKVSGTNDNVLKLGNKTNGAYWVDFDLFVPTGFGGYYNMQHYEAPGVEWAFEVFFRADGTGFMNAGGANSVAFTYTQGVWFSVENFIDLNNDVVEIYFDDVLVHEGQFSDQALGDPGALQLGSLNFFAGVEPGSTETPLYYFDNITFDAAIEQILYYNEFDEYTAGDYIAVVDPDWWTTWSNTPGTTEDALISNEQSSTPSNSIKVDGISDLVFKIGNKSSGKFLIKFDYYVPSGFGAYYNLQHYEQPGVEWAFEAYFKADGTGRVNAGGENAATFTYNHDEWIDVVNVVDLDEDWAQVYFNEVLIHEWQFSTGAQGQINILQLGGANFFAGSETGETPTYFIDNLALVALVPPAQSATIDINAAQIVTTIPEGDSETITRTLGNTGESTLMYEIATSFNQPTSYKAASPWVSTTPVGKSVGVPVEAPNYTGGSAAPANRDVTLTYSGENASAIGLTAANMWSVAANFTADMVVPYNGMYLTAVDVFVNDPADAHKIQVYDMGSVNLPGPGELLYEQDFFPNIGDWTTVVLTQPVYVSGRDLWVGYWMDQPAGIFPAGIDAGPADPNGNWIKSGMAWSHLDAQFDANWNIRGQLTGEAGSVWLSVSPNAGEVEAGESDEISIELDASGLTPLSIYKGRMHVRSNDPVNQQINISVWITILTGVNEQGEQTYVSAYPNPANDVLFLKGNTEITSVILSNSLGQVVYEGTIGQRETRIATDKFDAGMYILTIQTANGTASQKIMIK